jgi:uracil phosphoribosyltransferase
MKTVTIIVHPLVQHKLTIMRDKNTPSAQFRALAKEIAMLLVYEVTRDLPLSKREIETPIQTMTAPSLRNEHIILVSILRAGNGLLDGALELIPSARVGFIGLYRDSKTLQPVEYYCKLPSNVSGNDVIIFDPMLATGHSAAAAISKVKELKPSSVKIVNLLAAPEGIETLSKVHPDVKVYVAALDQKLNDHGYIVPGLGDAGDRIFGTK